MKVYPGAFYWARAGPRGRRYVRVQEVWKRGVICVETSAAGDPRGSSILPRGASFQVVLTWRRSDEQWGMPPWYKPAPLTRAFSRRGDDMSKEKQAFVVTTPMVAEIVTRAPSASEAMGEVKRKIIEVLSNVPELAAWLSLGGEATAVALPNGKAKAKSEEEEEEEGEEPEEKPAKKKAKAAAEEEEEAGEEEETEAEEEEEEEEEDKPAKKKAKVEEKPAKKKVAAKSEDDESGDEGGEEEEEPEEKPAKKPLKVRVGGKK